jgi:hypothetical protein
MSVFVDTKVFRILPRKQAGTAGYTKWILAVCVFQPDPLRTEYVEIWCVNKLWIMASQKLLGMLI